MNGWSEPPHFTGVHMDDGAGANAPIWVSKREFSFKIAEFEKKLGKVMYILVQSDLNLERKKIGSGGSSAEINKKILTRGAISPLWGHHLLPRPLQISIFPKILNHCFRRGKNFNFSENIKFGD